MIKIEIADVKPGYGVTYIFQIHGYSVAKKRYVHVDEIEISGSDNFKEAIEKAKNYLSQNFEGDYELGTLVYVHLDEEFFLHN